jgi:hypothetical protein
MIPLLTSLSVFGIRPTLAGGLLIALCITTGRPYVTLCITKSGGAGLLLEEEHV